MTKMTKNILIPVGLLLLINSLCTDVVCAQLDQLFPKKALPTQSGYLNIKEKGARMFYAYYEALQPAKQISDTPILLWLQGGAGCSGLIGNLYELGPWRVEEDLRLHRNSAPWNRIFGLLFVDSPIGSGFSVPPSDEAIPTNQEEVAKDLYSFLEAFYDLNHRYRSRPFYVTGESYAGKYVPSLAYYMVGQLDEIGSKKALRIDGLAIGNGMTHPEVQVQAHAKVAYAMGLIDFQQKMYLETLQQEAVNFVRQQKWNKARKARNRVLIWLEDTTGLATLNDIRRAVPYYRSENGTNYLTPFVNLPSVKEALKADANRTWKDCSDKVSSRMGEDIMKSSKWKVERLLLRLPVLLYQGQFDLRDGVVSVEEWIQDLDWNALADFWASERKVWKVSTLVAGYIRSHSNLTHVVVAGAGHSAPADQNLHTQVMIESWVSKSLASSSSQPAGFRCHE
uniref:Carboxypeptidase n=1 Tax=Araucaria cunninghamii TaxID=56994 RepID=A0A0D6QSR8_ARACU